MLENMKLCRIFFDLKGGCFLIYERGLIFIFVLSELLYSCVKQFIYKFFNICGYVAKVK